MSKPITTEVDGTSPALPGGPPRAQFRRTSRTLATRTGRFSISSADLLRSPTITPNCKIDCAVTRRWIR